MPSTPLFGECNDPHVFHHGSIVWAEDDCGDLAGILDGATGETFCSIRRADVQNLPADAIQRVTAEDLRTDVDHSEHSHRRPGVLVESGHST